MRNPSEKNWKSKDNGEEKKKKKKKLIKKIEKKKRKKVRERKKKKRKKEVAGENCGRGKSWPKKDEGLGFMDLSSTLKKRFTFPIILF